jgi:hypothetical protein
MNDIARQSTEAKRQSPTKIKQGSNDGADGAKNQESPSEFAERVHEASLEPASFEVKR